MVQYCIYSNIVNFSSQIVFIKEMGRYYHFNPFNSSYRREKILIQTKNRFKNMINQHLKTFETCLTLTPTALFPS